MLRKMLVSHSPDKVFVVWDGSKSEWRKELYSDYKKKNYDNLSDTTKVMLASIHEQEDVIRNQVLPELPIVQLYEGGIEADDIVCAACHVLSRIPNQKTVIASTDHDFYQLLEMADIAKDTTSVLYTKEDFEKQFGFSSTEFLFYRAMVGDSSDNIKGVTGIGEKTAKKILTDYKSLNEFLEMKDVPKEYRQKNLLDEIDVFERNVKLIDLFTFPEHSKLMNYFIRVYNDSSPKFKQQEFKQYLMVNKMFSILGNFNSWKKPFIRLGV